MADDPLDPYRELARRHGVDPDDEDAILRFLRDGLQQLDPETREQAFLDVLSSSTGFDYLRTSGSGVVPDTADPWLPHLLEVADGSVELADWDESILRYMHEEVMPHLLELHRLEVNQHIALDEVFSRIRPTEQPSAVDRAIRVVAWVRDYQSLPVLDAVARFLSYCNSALASGPSSDPERSERPLQLFSTLLDHLCYLDSLLQECAREPHLSHGRRMYEDVIDLLRRAPEAVRNTPAALRELVVLEREFHAKARYLAQLLCTPEGIAETAAIERRLGFEGFYRTIRLAVHSLGVSPLQFGPDAVLDILHWTEDVLDRPEVRMRDTEIPYEEPDWGAPISYSWMRIQELALDESAVEGALAGV
jgi:hypothetical protein